MSTFRPLPHWPALGSLFSEEPAPPSTLGAEETPLITNPLHQIPTRRPVRNLSPDDRVRSHKPKNVERLLANGKNFSSWFVRIKAAFRALGITFTERGGSAEMNQMGIDLLLDSVENGLIKHVTPARGPFPTPFDVLAVFESKWAQSNKSYHSELIAKIWTLSQGSSEAVEPYVQRAEELFDTLVRSGGEMPDDVFFQCLKRGLQDVFSLTVKFLEAGPAARNNASCLLGDLLAEESRLHHHQGLQQGASHGFAGPVTGGAAKREWTPKDKNAQIPAETPRVHKVCWNCGGTDGHDARVCKKTKILPYKFIPADFVHKYGKKTVAKPAANPVLEA